MFLSLSTQCCIFLLLTWRNALLIAHCHIIPLVGNVQLCLSSSVVAQQAELMCRLVWLGDFLLGIRGKNRSVDLSSKCTHKNIKH